MSDNNDMRIGGKRRAILVQALQLYLTQQNIKPDHRQTAESMMNMWIREGHNSMAKALNTLADQRDYLEAMGVNTDSQKFKDEMAVLAQSIATTTEAA